jgi:undecaprenyl-phosphate 4-deoxy-4-formamido-L-arabinose transferase
MSASIVIPVFNAQNTLRPLVQALASVPELHSLELILVNDASRDNSWEVICQLAAQHGWIRGINLSRNYGQHNAPLCGIRAATREVTITMDDDLQNPPEEIPRMLAKLREGYDVVYGTPQKGKPRFSAQSGFPYHDNCAAEHHGGPYGPQRERFSGLPDAFACSI